MQRKLIKVGTSAAVIIPKVMLDERGMKIGDVVQVELSKKALGSKVTDINPEIFAWTEKLRKKYKPMLKKLASS